MNRQFRFLRHLARSNFRLRTALLIVSLLHSCAAATQRHWLEQTVVQADSWELVEDSLCPENLVASGWHRGGKAATPEWMDLNWLFGSSNQALSPRTSPFAADLVRAADVLSCGMLLHLAPRISPARALATAVPAPEVIRGL